LKLDIDIKLWWNGADHVHYWLLSDVR
jgi:hypothetical protein